MKGLVSRLRSKKKRYQTSKCCSGKTLKLPPNQVRQNTKTLKNNNAKKLKRFGVFASLKRLFSAKRGRAL